MRWVRYSLLCVLVIARAGMRHCGLRGIRRRGSRGVWNAGFLGVSSELLASIYGFARKRFTDFLLLALLRVALSDLLRDYSRASPGVLRSARAQVSTRIDGAVVPVLYTRVGCSQEFGCSCSAYRVPAVSLRSPGPCMCVSLFTRACALHESLAAAGSMALHEYYSPWLNTSGGQCETLELRRSSNIE